MEIDWGSAVLSLGVGVGLAAAAGLRVFLPLFLLGLAAHLEWLPLTEGFAWLATGPVLTALAVATVLEVGAYYIPLVDNLLDLAAAPLAVMAGVIATAAVITDLPPVVRWSLAIIAGGGVAGLVQSLTSITRLKSSATTAGAGNPILATLELVGSLAASLVALVLPVVALLIVVGVVVLVRRVARRVFRRAEFPRTPSRCSTQSGRASGDEDPHR
jgi:hypothetical protein